MEQLIAFLSQLDNYAAAVNAVLAALIALFVIIPGDQPEKTLQSIVDLIKKISRK